MAIAQVAVGGKVTATLENAQTAKLNLMAGTTVIPASISGTGASLNSTTGVITFSGCTGVSVNTAFTSAYDNYDIIYNIDSTAGGALSFTFRLRLAGTDASAANYDTQTISGSSATVVAVQTLAATNFAIAGPTGTIHDTTVKVWAPARTVATRLRAETLTTLNPMTTTAGYQIRGGLHQLLTAYDGFTLTPSANSFSGAMRIVGLNGI